MKKSKNLLLILSIVPLFISCGNNSQTDNVSLSSNLIDTDIQDSTTSTDVDTDGSIEESSVATDNNTSDSIYIDSTAVESSDITSDTSDKTSDTSDSSDTNVELEEQWQGLDLNTYGNTFRKQLQDLIKQTGNKTISYKNNNSILAESDKAASGDGIVPFYHSSSESYSGDWNKEHVWPNSRGAGKTGPGSDPHMLRPTISSENSSRSNYFYGNGSTDGSNTWDPATFGYEAARGEAARIIFYCATRYYNTCGTGGTSSGSKPLELSNNPNDSKDEHTMGRLDRLIEWNNKYQVTEQEKKRNEYLYSNNFGRNPFIDHPELVNYIWDTNGIRTTKYTGSISSGSSGSSDTKTDTDTSTESTYEYDVVTDLTYLSTYNTVSVVATDNSVTAAMKDEPSNSARPWYLASETVTLSGSKVESDSKLVEFEVIKNSSGLYSFKTGSKYLYHYIDGTHYSIGYSTTETPDSGSIYFDLECDSGSIIFKGELGVYLDFQSNYSTFSGSSSSNSKIKLVYQA